MAGNIFDDAKQTIAMALAAVTAEIDRNAQIGVALTRTQQHVDALKRNEADLIKIDNDLAVKVAQARKTIDDAEGTGRDIVSQARAQAHTIESDARKAAGQIRDSATAEAKKIIAAAKESAAQLDADVAKSKTQLAELQKQYKAERERLAQIKKSAAEFAAGWSV